MPIIPSWSPDGIAVIEAPHLVVPILTPHPLWLACIGEVVTWRAAAGVRTTLVRFDGLGLFDPDARSHLGRAERAARPLHQDAMSRFARSIAGLPPSSVCWRRAPASDGRMADVLDNATARRLAPINLTSEGLSLTSSRFPEQFLPTEAQEWMADSWARTFLSTRTVLAEARPDMVLVFNGRFVLEGAARGATLEEGIPVYGFDQGWSPNSITIYRNHVHDYAGLAAYAEFLWNRDSSPLQRARARAWLDERIGVAGGGDNPYSRDFARTEGFFRADARRRVAVFTSSSDELFSIDTEIDTGPENQMRWIRALADIARADTSIDLQVRIHPNMAGKPDLDLAEWREIAAHLPDNVTFHWPDSGANSYALMREADLVIAFGSTITAEAAWMGKPVVELGGTHFTHLAVCAAAASRDEVEALIADPSAALREGQQTQALKYATWYLGNGDPLTYARLDGVFGSLGGRPLEPFGYAFRALSTGYRWLGERGLPRGLRSRHGLASLSD